MREQAAGRMLALMSWLLAALFAVSGCQSTSTPGKTLARDSNEKAPPKSATDIAWKRAAPSTALAQEHWTSPFEPLQTTAFQDQPLKKDWTAPPPETIGPGAHAIVGPAMVPAPPAFVRHPAKHHGKAPMALPNAPTEGMPVTLPAYVIRPPDVLLIELAPQFYKDEKFNVKVMDAVGLLNQPIFGQHLVRPDGTVELGVYGSVHVAGRTVSQAREEVAGVILSRTPLKAIKNEKGELVKPSVKDVMDYLKLDVLTYNSSVYYVITDGAGLGQQVYRFPVTGHETVLDAISHINGLPVVASPRRIWVARRNMGHAGPDSILPVDWKAISEFGAANTNWQLMPGDRVFVQADPVRRFNNNLGKMLEPIERMIGATLLTGQTVNTIRNGTNVIR